MTNLSLEVPFHLNSPQRRLEKNTHRIVFLDTLRFIGAGAVVFQHFVEQCGDWGQKLVGALSPGVFGVVLFFIVSGFVMPMSASGNFNWRTFAIRRFFRIYPLVFTVFILLATIFATAGKYTAYDWLANFFLVQDYVGASPIWGVTWTLSLEIIWYFIFAASLFFFGPSFNSRLSIGFPILLLSAAVISIVIGHRLPLARPGMIYAAVLGCQFYLAFVGRLTFRRIVLDLCIFITVSSIDNVVSFGYFRHPNITLYQALVPWVIAPVLFISVALVPRIRNLPIFNNSVISWLGTVSFSTYLLHPFAWEISKALLPAERFLILPLALTLALSAVGYYTIELPAQALGRKVSALIAGLKIDSKRRVTT